MCTWMYFITTQTENYTLEQQLILWGETLLSSELLGTIIQSGRSSTIPGGSTVGAAACRARGLAPLSASGEPFSCCADSVSWDSVCSEIRGDDLLAVGVRKWGKERKEIKNSGKYLLCAKSRVSQ